MPGNRSTTDSVQKQVDTRVNYAAGRASLGRSTFTEVFKQLVHNIVL
jgi:hypothetical protein